VGAGGAGGALAARITQESAELLGLAEGMTVIALCKATAVRVARVASRASTGGRTTGNRLAGSVASALRGEGGDEIAVALEGGLQLVGFAPAGSGLRVRQRATATVDESAVVVALPG
jgi:molybdate transport system regulatory protein